MRETGARGTDDRPDCARDCPEPASHQAWAPDAGTLRLCEAHAHVAAREAFNVRALDGNL